jgi:hypothetical protein
MDWELIGYCKYCGGKILHNDDEGKSAFNPCEPDCLCELKEEEKSNGGREEWNSSSNTM